MNTADVLERAKAEALAYLEDPRAPLALAFQRLWASLVEAGYGRADANLESVMILSEHLVQTHDIERLKALKNVEKCRGNSGTRLGTTYKAQLDDALARAYGLNT